MLLLAAALSGCGRGQEEKSPKPEEEKMAECREPEVQEQVQKDREDSADSAKEESPKVSEGVFLFADSDKRVLEEQEAISPSIRMQDFNQEIIYGYNPHWYDLAVNEIYARHGYAFQTENIRQYFEAQPWYEADIEPEQFQESIFNEFEKKNIQMLLNGKEANKKEELLAEGNTYTITSNTTYEPVFRNYTFQFQVPEEWLAQGYSLAVSDTSSDSAYWVITKNWREDVAELQIIPMEFYEGEISEEDILWKDHVCMVCVSTEQAEEELKNGIKQIKDTIYRVQR